MHAFVRVTAKTTEKAPPRGYNCQVSVSPPPPHTIFIDVKEQTTTNTTLKKTNRKNTVLLLFPFWKQAKGFFYTSNKKGVCSMKNVFKLWFIAFTVIMICPAFAQSESDFNVDLTKDGTGVVITGYTGKQAAITIPAKIQGYPVKEIGNQALSAWGDGIRVYTYPRGVQRFESGKTIKTDLTSVTIPAGVEIIGERAFFNQSKLTSVNIPASVTSIGEIAFAGCSSLTTVTIPASVTSIERYAFSGCSKLATVNFSEGLVEIGDGAFAECIALKTIKLPNSLTKLGYSAFVSSRDGITAVTLGTGLTEIPDYTFSYFDGYNSGSGTQIQTIVIPEGVTKIGQRAFKNCRALTSVTLPSTLLEIEVEAFYGCNALTTVTIPAALTSVVFSDRYTWEGYKVGGGDTFVGCSKLLLATRAALQKLGWDGKLE
jgi:hypothetical protein